MPLTFLICGVFLLLLFIPSILKGQLPGEGTWPHHYRVGHLGVLALAPSGSPGPPVSLGLSC